MCVVVDADLCRLRSCADCGAGRKITSYGPLTRSTATTPPRPPPPPRPPSPLPSPPPPPSPPPINEVACSNACGMTYWNRPLSYRDVHQKGKQLPMTDPSAFVGTDPQNPGNGVCDDGGSNSKVLGLQGGRVFFGCDYGTDVRLHPLISPHPPFSPLLRVCRARSAKTVVGAHHSATCAATVVSLRRTACAKTAALALGSAPTWTRGTTARAATATIAATVGCGR